MKKVLRSVISFFLAVIIPLMTLPLWVHADSSSAVTFSGIDFFSDAACTTPIPQNNVSRTANVTVRFQFGISPTATEADVNSTYAFTIPKEIPISSTMLIPVYDGTVHVADVTVNPTSATDNLAHGTLKLLTVEPNGGGYFKIGSQFNLDNNENETPVLLNFTVDGTIISKSVNFDQPAAAMDKSGVFDASSQTIAWTIHANSNTTTVNNGVLNDKLASGLTYVDGSFAVGGNAAAPSCMTGTDGRETLNYTFPDTSFSDTKTITFKTKVDPSLYNSSVTNTATLSYDNDNGTPSSATSNAVATPVTYITKSAAFDSANNRIDWEIDFDTSNMQLGSAVVTDLLPSGLLLDSNSNVSVKDTSTGNSHTVGTDSSASDYYATSIDSGTGRTLLTYNAPSNVGSKQVLTFSTPLPSDYFQRNLAYNFTNTATLKGDGVYPSTGVSSNSVNPAPQSSVISKTCVSYNSSTQTAVWRLTVDKNAVALPGVTVTDTIPSDQDYNNDAAFYSDSNFTSALASQPFSAVQSGQTLTWNLGDIPGATTYYIEYSTKLHDDVAAQNGYYTIKNTAVLTGTSIPSSSSGASTTTLRGVISKSSSYDYVSRNITWNLNVNSEKMVLTGTNGVLLKDDLSGSGQQNFTFEDNSVKIGGTAASAVTGIPTGANEYYYDSANKILWVNVGNLDDSTPANRAKTVTFISQLTADAGVYFAGNCTNTVSNTATILDSQYPSGVSASCTQTITNNMVQKTGISPSGADYIDWKVVINQNSINLSNIVLEDDLSGKSLSLDTSSVNLYKQTLLSNGSFASGSGPNGIDISSPVPLTADNVKYDASTGLFDFTMPDTISDPYILVFRTYVDKSQSGNALSISNTISFKGTAQERTSTSPNVSVKFQWGVGAAYGFTGSAAITKLDQTTGNPVAGAVFELLDPFGNVVQVSGQTDSNGKTSFDQLRYNVTYTVKEKSAPDGYELNDTEKTVTLDSSNTTAALSFSDTRKTTNVLAVKTDSNGNPLAGADFTLYDASSGTALQNAVSGSDGVAEFSGVCYGSYKIAETKAPDNYLLTAAPQYFSIDDSNSSAPLTLSFSDDKAGVITVTKTDAANSKLLLANAAFELYDSSNTLVETATTNADGVASFGGLTYGSYTVKESASPDGYELDSTPQAVSLTSADTSENLVFKDVRKTANVNVKKTDENGSVLNGAVFTLCDSTGTAVTTAESGADGIAEFENVPIGNYTIKETKAPQGYLLNQTVQKLSITEENYKEAQNFTVADKPAPVAVTPSSSSTQGTSSAASSSGAEKNPETGTNSAIPWFKLCDLALVSGGIALKFRFRRHKKK